MALCHRLSGKRRAWRTAARSGTRRTTEFRAESHPFEAVGSWFRLSGSVGSEQASRTLTRLLAYERRRTERGCVHSEPYVDTRGCAPGNTDARGSVRPVASCRKQGWSGAGGASFDQLSNASFFFKRPGVRLRHPISALAYLCTDCSCGSFVHRLDSSRGVWRCFAGCHYAGILRGRLGDLAASSTKTLMNAR